MTLDRWAAVLVVSVVVVLALSLVVDCRREAREAKKEALAARTEAEQLNERTLGYLAGFKARLEELEKRNK